jgi:sugar lactone lactonase YvrE
MAYDHRTGTLYVADTSNNRIRAISRSGIIRTVAGSGHAGWVGSSAQARAAHLNGPTGLALSHSGQLYIACELEIVRLDKSGSLTRVAGIRTSAGVRGMGGPALDASTDSPNGLALDGRGDLYVTGSATKGLFVITPGGRMRDLCLYCFYPRGIGGIITAPDGMVIAMNTQRIERYTTPTTHELIVNFARAAPVDGVRGIEPLGITVATDGTIYIDTNRNAGFTNATTLMAIRPASKAPTILWRQ